MGTVSNLKIALNLDEVLIEHDLPQLFSAFDAVGTHYLCLLVNVEESRLEYAGMPVSKRKIQQVKTGQLDLRNAFQHSEIGHWYLIENFEEATAYAARIELSSLPEEWLPSEGFYLEN